MEQDSFGNWLRLKRKALDLTRQGLADRVACSAVTIRKIEAEERRPSAQIADRLADILDIPQDERPAFLRFARGDWKYAPNGGMEEQPWRKSNKATVSNLPATTTSLIGREREIQRVRDYLLKEDIRLVTLIGPPGIGKTRLSIAAARDFPKMVFFIALAPLENPVLLPSIVAQTLGYVSDQNLSAADQLKEGIGDQSMLLLLDNCEHLIDAVASLVSDLLSACPQLKILATSRESLRVPGEWLYAVPALQAPEDRSSMDLENAAAFPALTLFAERARAVRADFALNVDNLAAVSAICARLDGLPLAIELIAARIRLMPPQALLERLTGPLMLSSDGMRAASARHKTLNHAIGWSYALLSAEEQLLFARLSIFSGGFTLGAAEAVFSRSIPEKPVSNLIASLFDKSLLQRAVDAGAASAQSEPRYTMLVTIQQFALDCLRRAGEGANAEAEIRNRHLAYFHQLAEQADKEMNGPGQVEWLGRLYSDHDNLRAALEWTIASDQTEAALKMAGSLFWFWFRRSDLNEGRRWLERVVALPDAPSYPEDYANALSRLANILWLLIGPEAARPFVERALAVALAQNDRRNTAQALEVLGQVLTNEHNFAAARTALEESRALFRELGDEWEADANVILAQTLAPYLQKDWASSLAIQEQALASFRKFGDIFFLCVSLRFIGNLHTKQGNPAHGMVALREALVFARQVDAKHEIATILGSLGEATQTVGNFPRAVSLYEAAKKVYISIGAWRQQQEDEADFWANLTACHARTEEAEFVTAVELGSAMTIEQAITFALELGDGEVYSTSVL